MSEMMTAEEKKRQMQKTRSAAETWLTAAQGGDVISLREFVAAHTAEHADVTAAECVKDFRDANGRTAAHFAASAGHVGALSYLVGICPEAAALLDKDGAVPLLLAAACASEMAGVKSEADQRTSDSALLCARLLLQKGADADAADSGGVRPLHHAAAGGAVALVESLVAAGASLQAQSGSGTPLHWAAGSGRGKAVKRLLELGAPVDAANSQGLTPIVMAAVSGSDAAVAALADANADVGLILSGGLTVLHICAELGLGDAVDAVLRIPAGAKCASLKTHDDKLVPAELAARGGYETVAAALLPLARLDASVTLEALMAQGVVNKAAEDASRRLDEVEAAAQRKAAEDAAPPSTEEAKAKAKALNDSCKPAADAAAAEAAQAAKKEGNALFAQAKYAEAVERYDAAVALDGRDASFYSNRAACQIHLGSPAASLADAELCVALKSDWPKAHFRKATALMEMGEFEGAASAAWEGLRIDEDAHDLKKLLKLAVKKGREKLGKA